MDNGVKRGSRSAAEPSRAWARDALGAILLVEAHVAQRLLVALDGGRKAGGAGENAFGEPVAVEQVEEGRAAELVARASEAASRGERVAIVSSALALASARAEMRAIAKNRLAVVAHAFTGAGTGWASADAMALCDLGWGVLFADGVAESLDLSLIARRAAEDSGNPFVVVHERTRVRHTEPVAPPSRELCEAFVGPASARVRKATDAAHPIHTDIGERAFAERVPFALGSAMRELESLTGRHHDVLERVPASDVSLALLGVGDLGDSLGAEIARLRAAGHDVGAVKIVALRPFPGPRLVKMLSRALAVCVLEDVDAPLAQSNPLTREVKSAFADALTWAPEYPGIGRIPRLFSGVLGGPELEATDVEAIVHNMLADERGRRTFVLGEGELPREDATLDRGSTRDLAEGAAARVPPSLTLRGRARDEATAHACADLCVAALASALGLRARASVRPLGAAEGGGFAFDLVAGRERPRGAHAPHAVRCVLVDDASALIHANPFVRLAEGGILAVPSEKRSADAVWSEVPAYAKAIAFDRNARVVGWKAPPSDGPAGEAPWRTASAVSGLVLALAQETPRPVDGSLVAREVEDALRAAFEHDPARGPDANRRDAAAVEGGRIAREAFESHVEVPRATVERDEESIRFGRKDARASVPPRT